MNNLAPAIFPPAGIGDRKPANQAVLDWVHEVELLTRPENIFWCDGSEAENEFLISESLKQDVLFKLNETKLPRSYLHRSNPNDVARVEQFTFICTPTKEEAGPTNNWSEPSATYSKLQGMLKGAMRGRTMFVIPYIMGPPDSPLTKVGFEITDSKYVVLSMRVMTRMGEIAVKRLGNDPKGEWNRGVHSLLDVNPERRLICHFPQDNTIISVGSGYGGNVLLSKKCLALRIGSYLARKQGWLAEHMLILGVESPAGKKHYVAAAFPSACGKTNFAMLIPPKHFAGWKVTTVGDDIAWMQVRDGRLCAVNPENGYFGVVPGTSYKSNPNAMKSIQHDTLYTNVALADDGDVWWEGKDGPPPAHAIDWRGNDWTPASKEKAAHPNSRFAAPCATILCSIRTWKMATAFRSARSFSADAAATPCRSSFRRAIGSTARMSAQPWVRKRPRRPPERVGQVRRDPMAMLPFCGYNMGQYFQHWLEIGPRLTNPPLIFHVNWFRKGADGKFLWPGFGENMRVLKWVIDRCEGHGGAAETEVGFIPRPEDFDLADLDVTRTTMRELFTIKPDEWKRELEAQSEFFKTLGKDMPLALLAQHEKVKARFGG